MLCHFYFLSTMYLIPCLPVSFKGRPLRTHVSIHPILHKTTDIFFKLKDIPNIDVNFAPKIRSAVDKSIEHF